MERPASLARLESPKIRIHGQDLAFGSEDELAWLRRQNSSLLRQQQAHERSLKELRSELQQMHEEEVAQRVARHTHETASLVTRQEEQVQRIVQRYEQLLASKAEQNSDQIELEYLRRMLAETQSRAGDAEANFEAVEVQAAKQKRKIQKLQAHRAEGVRIMRRRLRSWISSASRRAAKANAFMTWSIVVSALTSEQAELQHAGKSRDFAVNAQRSLMVDWAETSHPTLLAIAGARPLLTTFAALCAWAVAVIRRRSEMELEAQLDKVSMQTTAALGALRAEALALRVSANRSAKAAVQTRAVLQLAAPFAVWARVAALNPWNLRKQGYLDSPLDNASRHSRGKGASMVVMATARVALASALHVWRAAAREAVREARHEALLQGHVDEASMQTTAAIAALRADMRATRQRGKRTAAAVSDLRALRALVAPFAAWSREMIEMRAKRRSTGDVVLNSGEAARRKAKQLEEVRAQNFAQVTRAQQQAEDAQRAAATASRREAAAAAVADGALRLFHRSQDLSLLQAMVQAWRATSPPQAKVDTSLSGPPTIDITHGLKRAAAFVQHLARVVHPEQEAALLQITFKLWSYAAIATRQAWTTSDSVQSKSIKNAEVPFGTLDVAAKAAAEEKLAKLESQYADLDLDLAEEQRKTAEGIAALEAAKSIAASDIAILEGKLQDLERQHSDLKAEMSLQKATADKDAWMAASALAESESAKAALVTKLAKLEEQYADMEVDLTEQKNNVCRGVASLEVAKISAAENITAMEAKFAKLEKEHSDLKSALVVQRAKADQDAVTATSALEASESAKTATERELAELREKHIDLEADLADQKNKVAQGIAALEVAKSSAASDIVALEAKLAELERQHYDLKSDFSVHKSKADADALNAASSLESLEAAKVALEARLAQSKEQYIELELELTDHKTRVGEGAAALEAVKSSAAADIAALEDKLARSEKQHSDLKSEISVQKAKSDEDASTAALALQASETAKTVLEAKLAALEKRHGDMMSDMSAHKAKADEDALAAASALEVSNAAKLALEAKLAQLEEQHSDLKADMSMQKAKADESASTADSKLKASECAKSAAEAKLARLEEQHAEQVAALEIVKRSAASDIAALESKLAELEKQQGDLKSDLSVQRTKADQDALKAASALEASEAAKVAVEATVTLLKEQQSVLELDVADHKSRIAQVVTALEVAKSTAASEIAALEDKLAELEKQHGDLKSSMSAQQAKADEDASTAASALEASESAKAATEAKLAELEKQHENLNMSLSMQTAKADEDASIAASAISASEAAKAAIEGELSKLQKQYISLEKDLAEQKNKVAEGAATLEAAKHNASSDIAALDAKLMELERQNSDLMRCSTAASALEASESAKVAAEANLAKLELEHKYLEVDLADHKSKVAESTAALEAAKTSAAADFIKIAALEAMLAELEQQNCDLRSCTSAQTAEAHEDTSAAASLLKMSGDAKSTFEMPRETQADASPIGAGPAKVSHGDKRAAALVQHLASVVHPEQEAALLHASFKMWSYAAIATRQVLMAEAEPTRRYLAEMQGMRSEFDKQLTDMRKKKGDVQKQAITAIRKEARSRALAERSKKLLFQERAYTQLLGYFYAWITAGAEVRHEQRLTTAMSETEQRYEQALACVRDESRSALKTAWNNSMEASRQAASFERRKAAEAILAEEPRTNWMTENGERPTTAAAIERQLEIREEEMRRQSGCFPQPIEPGCQILEIPDEAFCARTQRRTTLESMFDRHESQWIAGPFEVWYRVTSEANHARAVHEGNALAREARESRKGLFIAALRQQAKYWQASAFGSWRHCHMEAKCQRLLTTSGQRKRPASGPVRQQRGSF